MSCLPHILALTDDPAQIRRWTEILADIVWVWQATDVLVDVLPELVLTDRAVVAEGDLPHESLRQAWRAAEVGLVRIGGGAAADVHLSADFRPRELQLVCPLLAEAIRWRRECHRARKLQQTFSQLALTDALTGLPNRRAWEEEILARSARGRSAQGSVCLALFDVDHFKSINDRFGHIAGDEILCHVGRGLARARGDSDYVARLGGDEFALLLEGRNPETAATDVEALRIAACTGAPHTQVTGCMGLVYVDTPLPGGFEALFESADIALRLAKLSGRNRTVAGTPPTPAAAGGR